MAIEFVISYLDLVRGTLLRGLKRVRYRVHMYNSRPHQSAGVNPLLLYRWICLEQKGIERGIITP